MQCKCVVHNFFVYLYQFRSNADEEKEREERRSHIDSLEVALQELEARLQSTR